MMNVQCKSSKTTSGFSLIELMVVIAIVALLTAIAVPSYKSYLSQSKVTEIFSLASDQMGKYQQNDTLSTSFDVVTSNLGSYIATAEIAGEDATPATAGCTAGTVCIVLNTDTVTGAGSIDPALAGVVLTFTPSEQGTVSGDATNVTIGWTCTFANASSSTPATAATLLSPGDCTGV